MRNLLRALTVAVMLTGGLACATAVRAEGQAGQFDYYALALSWSPTYCEGAGRNDNSPQCNGARPFAFVVHGLWPQYNRGWPQDCRTQERPWVSDATINSMMDIMPSRKLVIHEYKKHGTCSGLSPDAYFTLARRLFTQITIPERFRQLREPVVVSPDEVEAEFLKANPALKPEMVSIACHGRNLTELRICFGRDEKLQPCGVNETQRKLCSSEKIVMPPVRGGLY